MTRAGAGAARARAVGRTRRTVVSKPRSVGVRETVCLCAREYACSIVHGRARCLCTTRASPINDARSRVRSRVRSRARAFGRETMARARCGRRRAVAACAACAVLALSASVVDDPRADASASREGARTSVRAAGWRGKRVAWTGFARAASAAASADEGLFDDALFDDDAFDEDEDEGRIQMARHGNWTKGAEVGIITKHARNSISRKRRFDW